MNNKKVTKIIFTVFLVSVVSYFLYQVALCFLPQSSKEQAHKDTFIFEVLENESFYHVALRLKRKKIIRNVLRFKVMAKILSLSSKVRTGEYELSQSMSSYQVLNHLCFGKAILYPVVFQEGLNVYDMNHILKSKNLKAADDFLYWVKDKKYMLTLLGKSYDSFEGYLFPETYLLNKKTTGKKLIEMMVLNFKKNWEKASQNPLVSLAPHDAVILASMIEKETGYGKERTLISSVFHNRFKKNMKLQSDPTILYGILVIDGIFKKNIRRKDITRYTPYNTYRVKKLPKGPISNPGRAALWAALNPEKSPYLYFVSRNDGTHIFSKNYKDHLKAVKHFQMNAKMREGKSWRDLHKKTR